MRGYAKRMAVCGICLIICLAAIFEEIKVQAGGNVVYNGAVSYGYSTVGDFTVNGNMAFCFEHEKPTPATGTPYEEAVHDSPELSKVLYYGWGGPKQWGGFESPAHGIVATSLVASHYYCGSRIYTDAQSYYNWLQTQPEVPSDSLSLSASYMESYLTADRTRQRTDNLTLYADAQNYITIHLPQDITLHNITKNEQGSDSMQVHGGDTFYLTAPLTKDGTFESGRLTGNMGKYQAVIATTEASVQNLGYGKSIRHEDKAVEFSVKWIQRGDISIHKFLESEADIKTPAAGAQFTLTHQETGEQVVITADESGLATSEDRAGYPTGRLLGGRWRVEETATPQGYKPIEPFYVDIIGQGQVFSYITEDKEIRGAIQVEKLDKSTEKRIALSGTTFKIVNKDTGQDVEWRALSPAVTSFTEFTTDPAGQFTLPERLAAGSYQLIEINAPHGYTVNQEPIDFSVNEDYAWETPLTVTSANDNVKGNIEITKSDSEEAKALSGAIYEITAKEDIVTGDGTVRAKKGDVVDTVTTDSKGQARSKELYLGKYTVKEIKAPQGYVRDKGEYETELLYQDQNTPFVKTSLEFTNQPTHFSLRKTDMGTKEPLAKVEYQMWNKAFDVEDTDQEMSVKETLVTDEEGMIHIQYLTAGTYCIQETKALEGYVPDNVIHEVTVDEDGEIPELEQNLLELTNDYTKIEISKKDIANKEELPGARLTLKNKEGKVLEEWVSADEPHLIERLPAGDYLLIETEAPQGYEVAEEVKFTVEETGKLKTVEMFDKKTPVKHPKEGVKTGDDSRAVLWMMAAAAALAGAVLIILLKNQRTGHR